TLKQFDNCLKSGNVEAGVLCADGHYGYSQPIGGVIVYDGQISPSGVGFDIACGNKAVKTNLLYTDIQTNIASIMDEIAGKVQLDRKSTRLNSSHVSISYAVFCLKKKK